ncbi:MAG: 30S ribosomal protein S17 [Sedimentisphaerales bacterium]|nr:30S ribosomal protein S17 [Sedimentisphaerales bacterium]
MRQGKVKTTQALVVGKSGNRSIKVAVDYIYRHPKYGKILRRQTKLIVHDERNEAGVGDMIEIAECRPYSRTKSWRFVKVMKKAEQEQPRQ